MCKKDKEEDDRMDDGDKREKCGIEKSYGWWEGIGMKNEKMIVYEI